MGVRHDDAVGGDDEAGARAALLGDFLRTEVEGNAEAAEDLGAARIKARNAGVFNRAGVADHLDVHDAGAVVLDELHEVGELHLLLVFRAAEDGDAGSGRNGDGADDGRDRQRERRGAGEFRCKHAFFLSVSPGNDAAGPHCFPIDPTTLSQNGWTGYQLQVMVVQQGLNL